MNKDLLEENSKKIIRHIRTLQLSFEGIPDTPYNHMGATLADAILQAGMPYDTVVSLGLNVLERIILYIELHLTLFAWSKR